MRIEIDYDRCAGTGMCTGFAPSVFEIDDDGALSVLTADPPPETREAVESRQSSQNPLVRSINAQLRSARTRLRKPEMWAWAASLAIFSSPMTIASHIAACSA